jgi:hypothetical protein
MSDEVYVVIKPRGKAKPHVHVFGHPSDAQLYADYHAYGEMTSTTVLDHADARALFEAEGR